MAAASQIQTVNPIFILMMLPLFSYVIYPAIDRVWSADAAAQIRPGPVHGGDRVSDRGVDPDCGSTPAGIPTSSGRFSAFLVLTAAEVMVSVTHLEFAYTQAPQAMKSLVMCTYLCSIALGNVFTAAVNFFIQNPDGSVKLAGASYFFFFAGVMFATAIVFLGGGFLSRQDVHPGRRGIVIGLRPARRVNRRMASPPSVWTCSNHGRSIPSGVPGNPVRAT